MCVVVVAADLCAGVGVTFCARGKVGERAVVLSAVICAEVGVTRLVRVRSVVDVYKRRLLTCVMR